MTEPGPLRQRSRRSFLTQSAAVLGVGAGLGPGAAAEEPRAAPAAKPKVIDCHAHLHHHSVASWEADDRKLIDAADRLGIDLLCCSVIPRRPATVEGFREANGFALEARGRFPDRVLCYCYVNPAYPKEAADEVRRRVRDEGFIGIKLYNEVTCTDPAVAPIVEMAIELGVPILHHAGHLHYPLADQPRISDGGHLAELARRYPEAKLICAHVCGGGDWEWTIKALRGAPTVSLDTSGSVADEGVVQFAAQVLGADRLLFGCDMSMTAGVGRIRAAGLSDRDRARVLGGNMEAILRGRKA